MPHCRKMRRPVTKSTSQIMSPKSQKVLTKSTSQIKNPKIQTEFVLCKKRVVRMICKIHHVFMFLFAFISNTRTSLLIKFYLKNFILNTRTFILIIKTFSFITKTFTFIIKTFILKIKMFTSLSSCILRLCKLKCKTHEIKGEIFLISILLLTT